ncbi:MAG: hypothetical protein RBU37_17065 [Myxococcota bacterium]|jgi:hypothetical protein|nr:hypothetical protein [Myxococcota bacterium]
MGVSSGHGRGSCAQRTIGNAFLVLVLVMVPSLAWAEDALTFESLLQGEDSVSFSDDGSIYTFYQDGRFTLNPDALSGMTIEGIWEKDGEVFVVTGQWGWVNGLSRDNDYRELRLTLRLRSSTPVDDKGWQGTATLYDVKLKKAKEQALSTEEYEARMARRAAGAVD